MPVIVHAQTTWFNASWLYNKSVTISSSVADSTLTNFPILIYLSSDSDLASNAQSDADDIAFALDDGTQLDHEIEEFNSGTGELTAWVEIPSLASASNTVIYMYYGNGSATNQEDDTGTWSNNFDIVYHLTEGSAGGTTITDSTTSNINASMVDADGDSTDIDGPWGGGVAFDMNGDADYIDTSSTTPNYNTGGFMIELWFNYDNDGTEGTLIEAEYGGARIFVGYEDFGASTNIFFGSPESGAEPGNSSSAYEDATWDHVVFRGTTTEFALFVNGVDVASQSHDNSWTSVSGDWEFGRAVGGSVFNLNGGIDEIRMHSDDKGSDWIVASYRSTGSPGTYLTFGSQTSNPSGSGPLRGAIMLVE